MNIQMEQRLLLLLICWGGLLRLWAYDSSPVEHFDEGVYVSNFWFSAAEGYQYPNRQLYAPPLLPFLVEWTHVLMGPGVAACLGPSLLAGVAIIPLVWLFARRVAGPVAGLSAAALWATQDLAVLYSRTALTESLLCLGMLGAAVLGERLLRACQSKSASWFEVVGLSLATGLVCGLSWLTKYNGWLTLAILFSGALPWALLAGLQRAAWGRLTVGLLLVAGVAGGLWWPYWQALQPLGGYEAVAANHRQYFVGWAGWSSALQDQFRNIRLLTSLVSLTGGLACGLVLWRHYREQFPRQAESQPEGIQSSDSTEVESRITRQPEFWLIASWWCGLSLAIPLYHPYPRLLVPWVLASCLGLGVGLGWLARRFLTNPRPPLHTAAENPNHSVEAQTATEAQSPTPSSIRRETKRETRSGKANRQRPSTTAATVSAEATGTVGEKTEALSSSPGWWPREAAIWGGVMLVSLVLGPMREAPAWQDRRSLERITLDFIREANHIARKAGVAENQTLFYVYGEPALFYHLSALQRLAGPIGHLDFAREPPPGNRRIPTFLVVGPHAEDSPLFREQWEQWKHAFREVVILEYEPSLFVQLNKRQLSPSPKVRVILYQVTWPET